MLCIFKGRLTPDGRHADKDAGLIQKTHHTMLNGCKCEHDGKIANRKTGRFLLTREKRLRDNIDPVIRKLIEKDPTLIDDSLMRDVITADVLDLSPRTIRISESLQALAITIDSFPEGMDFGNGTTVNYSLLYKAFTDEQSAKNLLAELENTGYSAKIENGDDPQNPHGRPVEWRVYLRVSWCCFAEEHKPLIESKWQELCDLMEK